MYNGPLGAASATTSASPCISWETLLGSSTKEDFKKNVSGKSVLKTQSEMELRIKKKNDGSTKSQKKASCRGKYYLYMLCINILVFQGIRPKQIVLVIIGALVRFLRQMGPAASRATLSRTCEAFWGDSGAA